MTTENRNLRDLLAAATPAPWEARDDGLGGWTVTPDVSWGAHSHDAALIAALRNAAPDLLLVVEAMANMDEFSDDDYKCAVCREATSVTPREPHAPDCAWVLARKLTGGAA